MRTVLLFVAICLSVIGLACLGASKVLGGVVLVAAGAMSLAVVKLSNTADIQISVSGPSSSRRSGRSKHRFSTVGNLEPICPYCNRRLDKMPGRKKRCPHCGDFIYVRTRPFDRHRALLTASQAEQVEEEWAIHDGRHDDYLRRKQEREKAKEALPRPTNVEEAAPTCPYCEIALDKAPKRKARCPHCGQDIYARTVQTAFSTSLLTREDAVCVDTLKLLGDSGIAFRRTADELAVEAGRNPESCEVVRQMFSNLLRQAKQEGTSRMVYHQMALFEYRLGQPFFELLQQAQRAELLWMRTQPYVKAARIECGDSCPACRSLHGRSISVTDALATMPVPCRECTHELEDGKPGWCMCIYLAEMD